MTKQENICAALVARGCVEVLPSASRKYRQFSKPDKTGFYWVGKLGALRVGRCSSQSISIEMNVPALLAWYKQHKALEFLAQGQQ
jgi:hypothetical protein